MPLCFCLVKSVCECTLFIFHDNYKNVSKLNSNGFQTTTSVFLLEIKAFKNIYFEKWPNMITVLPK